MDGIIEYLVSWTLGIVQYLIQQANANAEASTINGYTALHLACQANHFKIVQYLLKQRVFNINTAISDDGYTALHVACHYGHVELVQYLLQQWHSNINASFYSGYTALHVACKENRFEIVDYLLQQIQIDVNAAITTTKLTALHQVCMNGHLKLAERLLQHENVNVEASTNNGCTPMHLACENGKLEVVKYLTEVCGANIYALTKDGKSPLDLAKQRDKKDVVLYLEFMKHKLKFLSAAETRNFKVIQQYIQSKKVNIETKNDDNGWTALHYASKYGDFKIVRYLVQYGKANVNATTSDGSTALSIVCQNGNLDIVKYLIDECKAKMNECNIGGKTPLDFAKENHNQDVVVYLMSKMTQPPVTPVVEKKSIDLQKYHTKTDEHDATNDMDEQHTTFLLAAKDGDLATITKLCSEKKIANVDVKDSKGRTALYLACIYGKSQVVHYLARHGNVNLEARTNSGKTALHAACQFGDFSIVKYLIKKCKNLIHVKDTTDGYAALHTSSHFGHVAIVKYLIEEAGAMIHDKSKDDETALDIAEMQQQHDVVKYLESKIVGNLSYNEHDQIIESDRHQLLKRFNDPTLEPFCVSLQYINECTSSFTSKLLGEGAFGKVFYGEDKILGLQLAIKKVPLPVMDKESLDQITLSFRREISVLKRFRHPNIVILYGFNVEVGQSSQVLVYEYLSHGPLSGFLIDATGRTRLSATIRLSIMYQIARSINFLHKGGVDNLLILHRDVKSGNICLTQKYTAKLIDCGLAKFVDKDNEATQKGSVSPTMLKSSGSAVFGTPGYICGNSKYNEACDMYSVGIVMAELIVGCLQSNQSSRGEQSFGDYFNRYIRDDDEELIENGWKLLMEDADPDAGWSNHNIENLCKLATQCIVASPKKRMLSSELTDRLWEISKNEFNIGYEDVTDNTVEVHKMNAIIEQAQKAVIDDKPPKPCVLCFKFNNSAQYVSCKKEHIICVKCVELLVQQQIGKSGNGVICDINHCNGSFEDDALFGKISPNTYNRYIVERGLQFTAEKHFLELKGLLIKQEQLTIQHYDEQITVTKQRSEEAAVRHCEMMQSLQNMGSMIDASTQRTLHALAYLATEKVQQCPTLVWLVPSDRSAGRSAKDWIKWAKSVACQKYDLYFVCQQSYTVVEPKMEISVPRQWLIQAGPVLQLSMLLIKAGLTSVTGVPAALPFPIPNLSRQAQIMMSEEFVSSLIDESTERIMNAFNAACTQNSDLPHLESSQLLTLTGVGYELIVEKATKLKRSQWKETMQPVMNQYGKLIWVKKEYVHDVMKTKKLDP